ncbi:uncharacterized protein LOC129567721 [Sitodiplosis mosellana]|uniref:uncharacterized protein LOC129567721 n=1 Tax=Sitodiplosis mosellana TaxID=263140 RepID=UPI002443AA80|nr:uncharacterized protein LOC129567721 [Sitodiplosis mosellana]XP_055300885.1 uncharacterized protein LOC129567721 [Sitodiplosis mosellana]XP_055300886.1 uncharacterized protein LOC129567721 [Sitodiplosis mosellana]XP_055300887.1 uncharacterized protein LOC129567721 [Sitodiplosis mosellana]
MAGANNKKQQKQAKVAKKPSQEKTQKKGKSTSNGSCCPYFFGSLLVFAAIGGLLAYDTQRNDGVFEKSAAGKFLKDTGALPYVEVAWTKSLSTSARGYQWAEVNVPIYANITYVTLKPYGLFLKDLGIVGLTSAKNGWVVTKEYVAAKTPVVVNFIEQYAPGLPQKISDASISTWNVISSTSATVYKNSGEFLQTKVFVGRLSPENLGKALNQTQIAVADYYSWFHKKVDIYAKIK